MRGKPNKSLMPDLTFHVNTVGDHRQTQEGERPRGTMPSMVSIIFWRFEKAAVNSRAGSTQGFLLPGPKRTIAGNAAEGVAPTRDKYSNNFG